MQYVSLGSSDLRVSRVCLGSMTWGLQNNQQHADEQIDLALSRGVNFIDTAEMYAVPPSEATYGKTEQIIGRWLTRHAAKRKDLILASKIAGPGLSYIRQGRPITGAAVKQALEASLERLQTDYLDLYQLHWPNRTTPHFGRHQPGKISFAEADGDAEISTMVDILEALGECISAGKVRFCGLSNETPWGLSQYLRLSEQHNLPRMVSMQNEFSLIHAKDWPYLIEQCVHHKVAYLPWSPLGGGMLSGKYLNGARPPGSRWTLPQRLGLFRDTPASQNAIKAYLEVAHDHGLSLAHLALAWCNQIEGVSATIIGATTKAQLEENLAAFELTLNEYVLKDIAEVLLDFPQPF